MKAGDGFRAADFNPSFGDFGNVWVADLNEVLG
jgi:hypothetical protein